MTTETAYPTILDRETAPGQIQENFAETMMLIREVVNYGTNLIPRSFISSNRTDIDIVIIGALLKHVVTMLDAIEILISQGSIFAAHVQVRSLFETRLYLKWILENDTERRARQFYVWHHRHVAIWAKRSIPGTPEHKRFHLVCDGVLDSDKNNEVEKEALQQLNEIENLLADPKYVEITKEFDRRKKPNRDYDVWWYQPWGPNNIADMAGKMGLSGEYIIFYDIFSRATHCQEFRSHVAIGNNVLNFKQIRYLEGIDTLVRLSLSYSFDVYHMILTRYRTEELENYKRKYITEWQTRFHNIRGVKYNVIKTGEPF
jgi:hypothetical protein